MREYLVVYTYSNNFADTYTILVQAKNYGYVEKNIKRVFLEGVEMTPSEAKDIIDGEWYYIIPIDDEIPYILKEEDE